MNRCAFALTVLLTLGCPALAVEPDQEVPDFTLKSMAGDNLRLAELRGEGVLINFWASWCGPCRQEMPLLQKIQQRYEPLGFTVLGVNVDEEQSKARRIAERLNLDFPLLLDSAQQVSEAYGVNAMPFTVLVDRSGKARYIHRGYKPGDEAEYVNQLKPLLRKMMTTAGAES
ncbi:MAG: TlpA family protein disulfide reductase [Pseudomonadales bacterium]